MILNNLMDNIVTKNLLQSKTCRNCGRVIVTGSTLEGQNITISFCPKGNIEFLDPQTCDRWKMAYKYDRKLRIKRHGH